MNLLILQQEGKMVERYRDFTVLITKLNRSIKRIKSEEMREFDLKGPHVTCLYYLYKIGKTTATTLCDIGQEDKATISRSIEYLEENGYIVCSSTKKKKYNAMLTLTDKGKVTAKAICKKIDNILDVAGMEIKDKKRKIMYECMSIISDNLEKICKLYDGGKPNAD